MMIFQPVYSKRVVMFFFILLTVLAMPLTVYSSDNRVHLISTEIPGGLLEKVDGTVVGAYAAFFSEASNRSGVRIDYRLVPWIRAVKETESSNDLLLFPFTRTTKRENRFSWIVALKEDAMCFVSVDMPINSLERARKLKRVIVWKGSSHQAYLENQGLKNLIAVSSRKDIIRILKAAPDAAWYWVCNQAQPYLDPAKSDIKVKMGTPVASEIIWLAGSKSFVRNSSVDKFVEVIEVMKNEKVLEKLLSEITK